MEMNWNKLSPLDYQERVFDELEARGFDIQVELLCRTGLPEEAIAQYVMYMARASHLQNESPSICAKQIHDGFYQALFSTLDRIICETIFSKLPTDGKKH